MKRVLVPAPKAGAVAAPDWWSTSARGSKRTAKPRSRRRQARSRSSAYIHWRSSNPPAASNACRLSSRQAPIAHGTRRGREGSQRPSRHSLSATRGLSRCSPRLNASDSARVGNGWTECSVAPPGSNSRGATQPTSTPLPASSNACSAPGRSATSALAASSHGLAVRAATRLTAVPKPRLPGASTTCAHGAARRAAAADPSEDPLSTTHTAARPAATSGASEARQRSKSSRVFQETTATVTGAPLTGAPLTGAPLAGARRAARRGARLRRGQTPQQLVELGRGPDQALARLKAAVPPQRLDALGLGNPDLRAGREVAVGAVDHVVLEHELQARLAHEHQPAVMAPPNPGALDAVGELLAHRRNLDVARGGDPLELGGHVDGIAHVLERVRADREVELAVGERPRLAVADVALHPGGRVEALLRGVAVVAQLAARLIGDRVEHAVGPRERTRPAAHVEHPRVVSDALRDQASTLLEHCVRRSEEHTSELQS